MWERIKLNENIKYFSFVFCMRYICFMKELFLGWWNCGCVGGKGILFFLIVNRIWIIFLSCGVNEVSV